MSAHPGGDSQIIGPDGVPIGVVRAEPPPPRWPGLHILLFALTLVSTTFMGGLMFGRLPDGLEDISFTELLLHPAVLGAGLSFSIPLMAILLAHEMGHYLTCRRYRLNATLPYFIPVPFGIGTMGAFIRIRSRLAGKQELFDVGAAGPLSGFIVAVPVLVAGIALSEVTTVPLEGSAIIFGEPLLFHVLNRLLHPGLPEGADLLMHPTAIAGWFGLLVTALNLLPFGQLDGGHITYAMFGSWQRRAAWPLLAVLVLLGFRWWGWWIWVVVALVMGVRHPWMPDEDVPLDPIRLRLGWLCLAILVLSLTPQPLRFIP